MSKTVCRCGHPRREHDRDSGKCTHLDLEQAKYCDCRMYERKEAK